MELLRTTSSNIFPAKWMCTWAFGILFVSGLLYMLATVWKVDRYGHTLKFTPHPIPNCEVNLHGPVQYWGGGPPGKFVVLYLLFSFDIPHNTNTNPSPPHLIWLVTHKLLFLAKPKSEKFYSHLCAFLHWSPTQQLHLLIVSVMLPLQPGVYAPLVSLFSWRALIEKPKLNNLWDSVRTWPLRSSIDSVQLEKMFYCSSFAIELCLWDIFCRSCFLVFWFNINTTWSPNTALAFEVWKRILNPFGTSPILILEKSNRLYPIFVIITNVVPKLDWLTLWKTPFSIILCNISRWELLLIWIFTGLLISSETII